MKGALKPLLLSLLLLLQAGECQEVKVMAAVGETVQLQPKTWPSSWVAINWKVKLHLEGYWILRHDEKGTSANPLLIFADRVSFHPGNLSLKINSVTEKESGLYTMDLMLGDSSGITNNFRLFVLGEFGGAASPPPRSPRGTQPLSLGLLLPDRIQQPIIKASTSQEHGQCYLTLSCLVPKAAWVTYTWSQGISSQPAPEDHRLEEYQADLQLEITKSSSNTFYRCNASNAISWGMATIDVEPLCNYTANTLAEASSLSYCQAKGLILLLVLGVLITGTVAVHIMAGRQPKQD
ncbi:natural killer cell receptor 2B4 isoform X1 [Alligator mississippiensis]|uniref:natural killer cell receptor 2B4 isoform X1 n=1 Tax=Alligator mississippiensis TaxID=8496 RepID=UPI00287727A6|nr:natural killer cell receptor 2B4 isoform X1 [Alligator mississippiensis]